jgi:hypothetical protein
MSVFCVSKIFLMFVNCYEIFIPHPQLFTPSPSQKLRNLVEGLRILMFLS